MKGIRSLVAGAVMMVVAALMLYLGLTPVFSTAGGAIYFGSFIILFVVGVFVWLAGWGALADYLAAQETYKRD